MEMLLVLILKFTTTAKHTADQISQRLSKALLKLESTFLVIALYIFSKTLRRTTEISCSIRFEQFNTMQKNSYFLTVWF